MNATILPSSDHSAFHLDPRAVLFGFLALSIWVSYADSLPVTAISFLIAYAVLLIPGPSTQRWSRTRQLLLWGMTFGGIVFVLYVLLTSTAEGTWFAIGPLEVSRTGVNTGARLALTFLAFIALARSLLLYATPSGLAAAVTWVLRPLRVLGFHPEVLYSFVFVTLRSIPGLLNEAKTIRMAQQSRGWSMRGSRWSRVRSTKAILVPVFAAAMRRSESLSMVLSSRGIDFSGTPTAVRTLRFASADYVVTVISVMITAGAVLRLLS